MRPHRAHDFVACSRATPPSTARDAPGEAEQAPREIAFDRRWPLLERIDRVARERERPPKYENAAPAGGREQDEGETGGDVTRGGITMRRAAGGVCPRDDRVQDGEHRERQREVVTSRDASSRAAPR